MAGSTKHKGFKNLYGDESNPTFGIAVGETSRALHIITADDYGTDWNVAADTHPSVYIHSATTPATDYIKVYHDATIGYVDIVGGTTLRLLISGTAEIDLTASALSPAVTDSNALGTTALMWSDLFLASGAVVNFNNGNVTLTHAAAALTLGGGDLFIGNGLGQIIGHTAQIAVGAVTSEFQMHGTAPADSTLSVVAWSADAVPPRLYFAKSRSATIGTFGIITTGDNLGEILAFGDDGVDFNSNANASAAIIFDSEGTIAADRIPGNIKIQTATNAAPSVLTTALTIDSAQLVTCASGVAITAGGLLVTAGRIRDLMTVADLDAQSGTLTVAQIVGGILVHTSATGGGTLTTDTAVNIVAGSSGVGALTADGQTIACYVVNDGTQVVTVSGDTGVTIADAGQTIGADESAILLFRRTAATTVTCYIIGA